MSKGSFYDKADKNIQRWARTIGAIITIVGAILGLCTWISSQFQGVISSQINQLRTEIQDADKQTNIQITRLELLTLINTQPENVAEIEKVAKHYFQELGADWYMTKIFSDWCKEYGGDPTIIIGVK